MPTESEWNDAMAGLVEERDRLRADLAAEREARERAEKRIEELEKENARLLLWLYRIEGGDVPCEDAAQLRNMAYRARVLGEVE